jgi:hypothetical protein
MLRPEQSGSAWRGCSNKVVAWRKGLLFLAILLLMSPALAQTKPFLPELQSAGALGADLFAQSGSTGMVLVVVRD